jgi:hypothetical protein
MRVIHLPLAQPLPSSSYTDVTRATTPAVAGPCSAALFPIVLGGLDVLNTAATVQHALRAYSV